MWKTKPCLAALVLLASLVSRQSNAESPECDKAEYDKIQRDYQGATQKIQSLEKEAHYTEQLLAKLKEADAALDEKNQILGQLSAQKETCDSASTALFDRVKALEETSTMLEKNLSLTSNDFSDCLNKVGILTKSSESLMSCRAEIEGKEKDMEQLSERLAQRQQTVMLLTEEVSSSRNELESIQEKIKESKIAMAQEKEELEARIHSLEKDLLKAKDSLAKAAQDSFIFSAAQFKKSATKFAAVNKALVLFIGAKIQPVLPPNLSDDIQALVLQARVTLHEAFQTHVKPHIRATETIIIPYYTKARAFFDIHIGSHVNFKLAMRQLRAAVGKMVRELSEFTNNWIEENLVEPIMEVSPMRELIPSDRSDRLFALGYVIFLLVVSVSLIRFSLRVIFKLLKCLLCMPSTFLRCSRGKHEISVKLKGKKSVESKKSVEKKEVSPKKENKKSGSKRV